MNAEKQREYNKKWYADNKAHKAAYTKQYRKENREKINAYFRNYRRKNREKYNAYQREYYDKKHHGEWFGTVCSACGESTSFSYDCKYCPNCGAKMEPPTEEWRK